MSNRHHLPQQSTSSPSSSSSRSLQPPPHFLQNISPADLQFLRQTQHSLGISPAHSVGGGSGSSSSTAGGALSLDPNALAALSTHFDTLMAAITSRVQTVNCNPSPPLPSYPLPPLLSSQNRKKKKEKVDTYLFIYIQSIPTTAQRANPSLDPRHPQTLQPCCRPGHTRD